GFFLLLRFKSPVPSVTMARSTAARSLSVAWAPSSELMLRGVAALSNNVKVGEPVEVGATNYEGCGSFAAVPLPAPAPAPAPERDRNRERERADARRGRRSRGALGARLPRSRGGQRDLRRRLDPALPVRVLRRRRQRGQPWDLHRALRVLLAARRVAVRRA